MKASHQGNSLGLFCLFPQLLGCLCIFYMLYSRDFQLWLWLCLCCYNLIPSQEIYYLVHLSLDRPHIVFLIKILYGISVKGQGKFITIIFHRHIYLDGSQLLGQHRLLLVVPQTLLQCLAGHFLNMQQHLLHGAIGRQ